VSDLTLSLGGVINYALLDGTAYSLPFLVTWYVLHQGEGPPIHSNRSLHQGSARDASHHLVMYASVMALMLPITWSLFFAGDVPHKMPKLI
jgi:hypothetical protein